MRTIQTYTNNIYRLSLKVTALVSRPSFTQKQMRAIYTKHRLDETEGSLGETHKVDETEVFRRQPFHIQLLFRRY